MEATPLRVKIFWCKVIDFFHAILCEMNVVSQWYLLEVVSASMKAGIIFERNLTPRLLLLPITHFNPVLVFFV